MNYKHNKPLTQARAVKILHSYGASESAWPENERQGMTEIIRRHDNLYDVWRQAQQIDQMINRSDQDLGFSFSETAFSRRVIERLNEFDAASQTVAHPPAERRATPIRTWAFAAVLSLMTLYLGARHLTGEPIHTFSDNDSIMLESMIEASDQAIAVNDFEMLLLVEPALESDEILI